MVRSTLRGMVTADDKVNPALHLRAALKAWAVPSGQTTEAARGDASAMDPEFWARHVELVGNVEELRRLTDELELHNNDVDDLRALLPRLYRAVFAVNTPWSTGFGGDAPALDDVEMRQLGLVALSLNSRASSNRPNDAVRSEIADHLSVARDLVAAAGPESLDAETRTYLLTVLDAAWRVVDRNRPPWEQRAAVQQATGAMLRISAQPPSTPAARTFKQRLGRAAIAVVTLLASAYAEGAASHLGELTVDHFLSELQQPDTNEIAPPPVRAQLEPAPGDPTRPSN